MLLFVGGCYQGKLNYALDVTGISPLEVSKGEDMRPEDAKNARLINHFHLLIQTVVREGGDAVAFAEALYRDNPDVVIVCEEIGMGIVPMDPFDRAWREAVGRALCVVAKNAERVERVVYGIAQRIK